MKKNRVKEYILENNKGIVINDSRDVIEFYLEYDESEENIIMRDIEGNILDYFNSGELDSLYNKDIKEDRDRKKIYEGWIYFEESENFKEEKNIEDDRWEKNNF